MAEKYHYLKDLKFCGIIFIEVRAVVYILVLGEFII